MAAAKVAAEDPPLAPPKLRLIVSATALFFLPFFYLLFVYYRARLRRPSAALLPSSTGMEESTAPSPLISSTAGRRSRSGLAEMEDPEGSSIRDGGEHGPFSSHLLHSRPAKSIGTGGDGGSGGKLDRLTPLLSRSVLSPAPPLDLLLLDGGQSVATEEAWRALPVHRPPAPSSFG